MDAGEENGKSKQKGPKGKSKPRSSSKGPRLSPPPPPLTSAPVLLNPSKLNLGMSVKPGFNGISPDPKRPFKQPTHSQKSVDDTDDAVSDKNVLSPDIGTPRKSGQVIEVNKCTEDSQDDNSPEISQTGQASNQTLKYPTKFMASTWRMKESMLQSVFNEINLPFAQFLQGQSINCSVESFLKFMQTKPEETFGLFLIALLTVEYVKTMEEVQLREIFQEQKKVPLVEQIISDVATYRYLQKMRREFSDTTTLNDFPAEVYKKLPLEIIDEADEAVPVLKKAKFCFETEQEAACRNSLQKSLKGMLFTDMDKDSTAPNFKEKYETSKIWTSLIFDVIEGLNSNAQKSTLDLLLAEHVGRNVGDKAYFQHAHSSLPNPVSILLPEDLVRKFSTNSIARSEAVVIKATPEELRTFKELVYGTKQPSQVYVTLAVYEMARAISVDNLDEFLFGGKADANDVTDDRKTEFLKIMISSKRSDVLEGIISTFSKWMSPDKMEECLNGLSVQDVVYFLGNEALNIKEFDVYQILISWSLHASGKNYPSLSDFEDASVTKAFQTVRQVLFLTDLQPHFGTILRQNCITFQDVMMAKRIIKTKTASEDSPKPWFKLGRRGDKSKKP